MRLAFVKSSSGDGSSAVGEAAAAVGAAAPSTAVPQVAVGSPSGMRRSATSLPFPLTALSSALAIVPGSSVGLDIAATWLLVVLKALTTVLDHRSIRS